jgi:hypothetical protein
MFGSFPQTFSFQLDAVGPRGEPVEYRIGDGGPIEVLVPLASPPRYAAEPQRAVPPKSKSFPALGKLANNVYIWQSKEERAEQARGKSDNTSSPLSRSCFHHTRIQVDADHPQDRRLPFRYFPRA